MGYTNAPTLPYSTQTYGKYFITQLVDQHIKRNLWVGTNCTGQRLDEYGLDEQNPMNGRYGFQLSQVWRDAPGSPLGDNISWVRREDTFTNFLMFQPYLGQQTISRTNDQGFMGMGWCC